MSRWHPELATDSRPIYQLLIEAIARDRANGRLPPGAKLPPHRELAGELGIGVGTVTRAYAEAERQGLIAARVGSGSFVTGSLPTGADERIQSPPVRGRTIDLARNLAPAGFAEPYLAAAMGRLAREDAGGLAEYAPIAGSSAVRNAAAAWSLHTGRMAADPDQLIMCNGAQQGLTLALAVSADSGDVLLCEAATYAGLRQVASVQGYALRGVALDEEGMIPSALDDAAAETSAKVVYLIPTLQNPTGRSMSSGRRDAIAEVIRRRDLILIEDNVYGLYGGGTATPIAAQLPDRAFFIDGASKSLAPGLRAGWLLPPARPNVREQILQRILAQNYAPSAIGHLIFKTWVEDATAEKIAAAILSEATMRQKIALDVLGPEVERPTSPAAPHLWLPLPPMEAERVALRALRAGVELTPPQSTTIDDSLVSGLRLCLGATDIDGLREALPIVRAAVTRDGQQLAEHGIV